MADEKENQSIEERVLEAIDMFRPQLQADGGDMEYVGIDEQNRVHLKLVGACGSCRSKDAAFRWHRQAGESHSIMQFHHFHHKRSHHL